MSHVEGGGGGGISKIYVCSIKYYRSLSIMFGSGRGGRLFKK